MRYCYLDLPSPNKAKKDMDFFMKHKGYKNLSVGTHKGGKVIRFFMKILTVACLPFRIQKGDVLILQYPLKKYFSLICDIAHWKGAETISLIHDLGAFRRKKLTPFQEIKRLAHTDKMIVLNQKMQDWLLEHGCNQEMTNLEIWDFYSECNPHKYKLPQISTIVYAGSLGERKNKFLYSIDSILDNYTKLEIFGKGWQEEKCTSEHNIHYNGCWTPDDFVQKVEGHWGLVWDGDSLDECAGNWGAYLKLNNPHKASFYLRAGLPIIVWKQSAIADFVTNRGIGIAVESLRELRDIQNNISSERYDELRNNVSEFSKLINSGYFFFSALERLK